MKKPQKQRPTLKDLEALHEMRWMFSTAEAGMFSDWVKTLVKVGAAAAREKAGTDDDKSTVVISKAGSSCSKAAAPSAKVSGNKADVMKCAKPRVK